MSTTATNPYMVRLKGYALTAFVDGEGNASIHRPHPRGEILQAELVDAELVGDDERAKKLQRQLASIRRRNKLPDGHSFESQRAELRHEWQIDAITPADAREKFISLFGITDAPLRNFVVTPIKAAERRGRPRQAS